MRKRDLWILALALALALAGAVGIFRGSVLATAGWGLSFREPGQTPMGTAGADQLRALDAAYVGDPGEKVLYLTFDAGYENGYTEKILDILRDQQVKAGFFLVGNYLDRNADLVRRMVAEGHTVGNHTLTHPDMSRRSGEAFAKEITGLEDKFREITGGELPKFYRPPQGVYSRENLEQAQAMGYKTVFWSLAYADWDNAAQPSRETAREKLLNRTHNGAVILLHATSRTNVEVLEELIQSWKAQGYRFGSLEELFSR